MVRLLMFLLLCHPQDSSMVGKYDRCFLKDCRELSVFDLTSDQKIVYSSFMERHKFKPKIIGSWSQSDSVIYFSPLEDYGKVLSKNYRIKKWRNYSFLVSEQDAIHWGSLQEKLSNETDNNELIKSINEIPVQGDSEQLNRKKKLLDRFTKEIIHSVISDRDILLKEE
jgi:hypothetical protein